MALARIVTQAMLMLGKRNLTTQKSGQEPVDRAAPQPVQ